MCGRGELGSWFHELGHVFRERPSPGPEAGRKRSGAAGEEVAKSVALEAEGDPVLAVEVAAIGAFLLKAFTEVISRMGGDSRYESSKRKLIENCGGCMDSRGSQKEDG